MLPSTLAYAFGTTSVLAGCATRGATQEVTTAGISARIRSAMKHPVFIPQNRIAMMQGISCPTILKACFPRTRNQESVRPWDLCFVEFAKWCAFQARL